VSLSIGGRLDNLVAIVTGAGTGIGVEYAKALAAQGARLCLCDIEDPLDVARKIDPTGERVIATRTDVANTGAVANMVERTLATFGTIDILINNAAIFASLPLTRFGDISADDWDRVMRVNVRGAFECIKAVTPHMMAKRSGSIINISSATVFKGAPMMCHYVSSKGAVIAMSRALARELGPNNVRVNCIAPGLVLSESVLANSDYSDVLVAQKMAERSLKRDSTPADLIGTLIFLASSESAFITGQTIVVDGGAVMH
jgi:NAD(P)-dependent dehydrogenase (short-subunit alcohol dehydrogenase family)